MNKTTNRSVLSIYFPVYTVPALFRKNSLLKILLIAAFLFLSIIINATTKTAIGNSGQGWSNASNWSPSGVPQTGDEVIIPVGVTISVKGAIYGSPNPNVIIRIYGTLDFDPSGKLDLGVNSAVGIYSNGWITTNGTSSELINIGGVTKYNGQIDGNLSGPRAASQYSGTSPNGFNSGVLAIKIVSFDYQKINDNIKLNWTASHTNDNDHFEVQRSKDGNSWTTLTSLPVTGNLHEINSYSYIDANADKTLNFYRIRLVNFDMHDNYSKTIAVRLTQSLKNLSVFPNPANTEAKIFWENAATTNLINIRVLNAAMLTVINQKVKEGENFALIDVSKLPSGIYTIVISDSHDLRETSRILVNN